MTTATNNDRAPPTPEQIRERRLSAKLSQSEAAELLHSTQNAWTKWECPTTEDNHRRMHPAFWELFQIKTARRIKRIEREEIKP